MVRADDFRELGEAVKLFTFDFTTPGLGAEARDVEFTCSRPGTLHGALVWFELVLDDEAAITNHPTRGQKHWGCSFAFLDAPRTVAAGETVPLHAAHDTTTVDFRFPG